jgi:hypothetical protein
MPAAIIATIVGRAFGGVVVVGAVAAAIDPITILGVLRGSDARKSA